MAMVSCIGGHSTYTSALFRVCSDIEREVTSGESDMSMYYAYSVGNTALFMFKTRRI